VDHLVNYSGSQEAEFRMKARATRFENLMVWQKAHPCVLAAYSQAILDSDS
jgi:hypothetical protein